MTTIPTETPTIESITDHARTNAVLFDMDGVILEGYGTNPEVHARALRDAATDFELDIERLESAVESTGALENYEYTEAFASACDRLGLDATELYACREAYSAERSIDRIRSGKRSLYPDADIVTELAKRCPTALISNNYDPTVSFVVDHFGLEAFSFVRGRDLGVEGFRRRKPEPYYLNEAIDALDLEGGLYVGDRETDLLAASRAGLVPVLIRRPHNESLEPTIDSYLEIDSLTELLELI